MNVLLKISIVLMVGFIGGKVAKLLKLPNVSGYLAFGLLLAPSISNFVSTSDAQGFTIISELALAVIAFSIGSEFVIKEMKKVGKAIFIITFAEVIGAVFTVFAVMYYALGQSFVLSIVVASMSAATAPAATLLVIRQYRAHGPLTKTILPVVALDDVFGIMAFGIAMSVAKLMISEVPTSIGMMIAGPFIEVVGSILLGIAFGFVLSIVVKKFAKNGDEVQVAALATIGASTGISMLLELSPLLTNILIGTVIVNVMQNSNRVFSPVNDFISPFYILFFTLAGASLDLHILASIGLVGVVYLFARAGGKFIGAYVGAVVTKQEKAVRNNLGWAMFPQGGISIGLSVLVRQQLPDYAAAITTIIMFGVLVFEITGPIFSKIAISRAKEINGLDRILDPTLEQVAAS